MGRKKKNLQSVLPDQARSPKEFYAMVLALQEEEKKRISRDLHDETGQIVIAFGALLAVLEAELKAGRIDKALAVIDENKKLMKEMAGKMKFMAFNLRPPALDILGLSAVLREYFAQCTTSSRLRIEFKENLKDAKLSENIEITLYRIIQEAIWNVLKHARAQSVKVRLLISENEIELSVDDDGQGFDVESFLQQPELTKMGLRGIRERVAILNGTVSVTSVLEQGTSMLVRLPLELHTKE